MEQSQHLRSSKKLFSVTRRKKKSTDEEQSYGGKKEMGECSLELAQSSDSDIEEEDHTAMRKVSTNKQIKSKVSIKEGYLLLHMSSSFQRWRTHYFKLRPRRLFYAKTADAEIFNEVDLADCSLAERSTKNVNCSFSIITPLHSLILCADSRKEMDEWISAIKAVQAGEFYEPQQFYMENLSGGHNWYTCTHARPTYCNVCRDVLSGVMNHGLSCEVCKFKAHKRCASKAVNNCKWATLSTVGKHIIEDEDGVWIPHQWMEGNLPVSAKCIVCERTCGSVLRLQDWRCLWCKAMVHAGCRAQLPQTCPLGPGKMSIVPPSALNSIDSDGYWQAVPSIQCTSPLLVFVNSKSGDNQGVKFLRRFRQFLNPAQVFDLMCTGPHAGLRMFQMFDTFRILVCGGDGSIGWVLTEMDKLNLHKKAQVGVLPLGTGNDLAQVMGWGNVFDDDTQVPAILERYERASAKLLDRWSIQSYEGPMHPTLPMLSVDSDTDENASPMTDYERTVANNLSTILNSDQNSEVIKSAAILCETIKDFVSKVASDDNSMALKCRTLDEKLNSLMTTLHKESRVAEEDQQRKLSRQKNDSQSKTNLTTETVTALNPSQSLQKKIKNSEQITSLPKAEADLSPSVTESFLPSNADHIDLAQDMERVSLSTDNKRAIYKIDESIAATETPGTSKTSHREKKTVRKNAVFQSREQLMLRANSLKKAVRQIIEHTEKAVDEQNEQTRMSKLSTQVEEDECLSITSVTSTSSNTLPTTSTSQMQSNLIQTQGPDAQGSKQIFQLLAAGTSSQEEKSPSNILENSTSEASSVLNVPRDKFPRLSPKMKVKDSSNSNTKCERRKGSYFEEQGCTHVNPDFNARGSFISRVLLSNAESLCAAATPLIHFGSPILNELFTEKCVMNSYFGIGLDAKIALDFHRKREEHPKKCSRTKNIVWFGMLAVKEFALKSYKNLDQRIRLECDGQHIPLPRLQGIVVLNIPSFMGGSNFWGGRSGNQTFIAPSYNDKILEVVGVFGTIQLGMAKVVPEGVLQHHRIAQCRTVKINILGDEGVPLQVDGEAWLQPPGAIKIEHKNRAQMLSRDRHFEETLKSWEDKQQRYIERNLSGEYLNDMELDIVEGFADTTAAILQEITKSVKENNFLSEELLPLVVAAQRISTKMRPCGYLAEGTSRSHVSDLVCAVEELSSRLSSLFNSKPEEIEDLTEKFVQWINLISTEMKKIQEMKWLINIVHPIPTEDSLNPNIYQKQRRNTGGGHFRLAPFLKKSQKRESKTFNLDINVNNWTVEEVNQWLETLQLTEYKENFVRNDIRGEELLNLEPSDLKGMGITKVGHIKRIQSGIKVLQKTMRDFNR